MGGIRGGGRHFRQQVAAIQAHWLDPAFLRLGQQAGDGGTIQHRINMGFGIGKQGFAKGIEQGIRHGGFLIKR